MLAWSALAPRSRTFCPESFCFPPFNLALLGTGAQPHAEPSELPTASPIELPGDVRLIDAANVVENVHNC
jgi:hypothetical protein